MHDDVRFRGPCSEPIDEGRRDGGCRDRRRRNENQLPGVGGKGSMYRDSGNTAENRRLESGAQTCACIRRARRSRANRETTQSGSWSVVDSPSASASGCCESSRHVNLRRESANDRCALRRPASSRATRRRADSATGPHRIAERRTGWLRRSVNDCRVQRKQRGTPSAASRTQGTHRARL